MICEAEKFYNFCSKAELLKEHKTLENRLKIIEKNEN